MKSRLPKYNNRNRSSQNSQIKGKRKLPDILHVILPPFRPAHLNSTFYLSEARQPRLNLKAMYTFVVVIGDLPR